MTTTYQIELRGDSSSNWSTDNPVLGHDEMAHEDDTGKFKIGDGTTAWDSLGYAILPPSAFLTVVNVAAPTGVAATDTANINTAITQANSVSSAILQFQHGQYLTNGNHNIGGGYPGALVIAGMGWDTEIQLANAANTYIFTFNGTYTPGLTMRDMYLQCNGANQTTGGGGIYAYGAVRCIFEHLWIDSPYNEGLYLYENGSGGFGQHNVVAFNHFTNGKTAGAGGTGYGLRTSSCDENKIIGNLFQDNGVSGNGHSTQFSEEAGLQHIIGNSFVNGGTGCSQINVAYSQRNVISGNIFDGGVNANAQVHLNGDNNLVVGNSFSGIGGSSTGAGVPAIYVDQYLYNQIIGNRFEPCATGSGAAQCAVLMANGADYSLISGNSFNLHSGNGTWTTGQAIYYESTAPNTVVSGNFGENGSAASQVGLGKIQIFPSGADDTAYIQAVFNRVVAAAVPVEIKFMGICSVTSVNITNATAPITLRGPGGLKMAASQAANTRMLEFVNSPGVTVDGMVIDQNGANQTALIMGISYDGLCPNMTISNCRFENIYSFAIFPYGYVPGGNRQANLNVFGNQVNVAANSTSSCDIVVVTATSGSVVGNSVNGVAGGCGIYIYEADHVTCSANNVTLTGKTGFGIGVGSSTGCPVTGNSVWGGNGDACYQIWKEVDNSTARAQTDAILTGNHAGEYTGATATPAAYVVTNASNVIIEGGTAINVWVLLLTNPGTNGLIVLNNILVTGNSSLYTNNGSTNTPAPVLNNCGTPGAMAPLASPAFTGTPTAPTPTAGDNSTKIATTAFVLANSGSGGGSPQAFSPGDFGYVGWSMDPLNASSVNQLTSGRVSLFRFKAVSTTSVGHVSFYVVVVGSGLTTGENWVGIYDTGQTTANTATLLAQTADQTTNFATAGVGGAAGAPVALQSAVTLTAGDEYFFAILSNGTTIPKFYGGYSSYPNMVNSNLSGISLRICTDGAGTFTTLPSTITNFVGNGGAGLVSPLCLIAST